jgi:hypothetical protein
VVKAVYGYLIIDHEGRRQQEDHSSNSIGFNEYERHNNNHLDESEYEFIKGYGGKQGKKSDVSDSVVHERRREHDVSKAHSLKNEIDNLDSEIKHLQSKLKNMIGHRK